MQILKQSTAITLKIGPFLDDTDGKTAETALTITAADVLLSKNGGAFTLKTEATAATHDAGGWYGCPIDATDTGTLGRLQLSVQEAGALPVWHEFMVVPANVWDSLFGADKLQVDLLQMGGVAQSATDLKDFADAGYDPATNKVQGVVLVDTSTAVTNDVGITQAAADKAWNTAVRALTDKAGFSLSTAGIKAIWDQATSALTTAGSIGKLLVDNINATISSRASHAAADVWSVATRLLTAGTNIVLAKGVGLTGLNDLSAAQVNTEVDTALADIDLDHLIEVTAGAEEPTDGSYLDQMMHKDVNQTFNPTTDSLEALRDTAPMGTAMRGTDSAALASAYTAARAAYLDELAAANIPADIDAIKVVTDALTDPNTIADALLERDIDQVEATAALHSLCTALLKAVSKIEDDAGTLKVYRTDGTTVHMSQAIATDAANDPIDSLGVGT